MPKLPVVAAIANYNMATELERLLPQVIKQGYDDIFVMDDASTDNSREVIAKFKGVKLIAGKTNRGAGANRNRIIGALKHEALLVHFLDADVELQTTNTAELVRQVAPKEPFSFVGGMIKTKAGLQHPWNYGRGAGLKASVGSWIQVATYPGSSKLSQYIRRIFAGLLADWPDPQTTPKSQEVFWCAEANLVVRSDIFTELGGFDEIYRETEILEFAIRARRRGLKAYFNPIICIRHTEADVRRYNRDLRKAKEMFKIPKLLGFGNWLLHDGKRWQSLKPRT